MKVVGVVLGVALLVGGCTRDTTVPYDGWVTTAQLYSVCSDGPDADPGQCRSFILGAMDGHKQVRAVYGDNLCQNITADELVAGVLQVLLKNEGMRSANYPAASTVIGLAVAKFPACRLPEHR